VRWFGTCSEQYKGLGDAVFTPDRAACLAERTLGGTRLEDTAGLATSAFLARENLTWGTDHVHGELLNLGIKISKRSIQKYIPADHHQKSGPSWSTFIQNHFQDIWACDFTVVPDLLFRPIYVFVIMELHTRRSGSASVTRKSTDQ